VIEKQLQNLDEAREAKQGETWCSA